MDKAKAIEKLARRSDHRTLALWAADCAERVLPYFEEKYPGEDRPRQAIEEARKWASTGAFHMSDVRGFSLSSHAVARDADEESPARFAARAAGQAMATAHVPTHSIAAAWYAAKAVWAADPKNAQVNIAKERDWQYRRLLELSETAQRT
ncbi:MAG: putative immunity protein [Methanomassiliicoccales archaeon]